MTKSPMLPLSLIFLLAIAASPAFGVTLAEGPVFSDLSPTAYFESISGCQAPPAHSNQYLDTDARVAVYIYVTNIQPGDVFSYQWLDPNGAVYYGNSFSPVPSGNNRCYMFSTPIAGANAEDLPGTWTVKGFWQNAGSASSFALFSRPFTIQSTGGGGGTTGDNLIQNPGAEITSGVNCDGGVPSIPGWTTDGNVGICNYGAPEYPGPTSPGPPNRGTYFFHGGYAPMPQMQQTINVSSFASQIDAGSLPYTLSGYLGGWSYQDDSAMVTLEFLNGSSGVLGTTQIGPVTAAERNSITGLLERSTTGAVPTGTRSIRVLVTFIRNAGSWNDAYADELSLVLGSGGGGGTPGCNYFVSPSSNTVGASGATGLLALVNTAPGCNWSATSNAAWITIVAGTSGSGSGAVSFDVAPNTSTSSRVGTLTIAGTTYTVTQEGAPACTYSILPTSATVPASGGSRNVSVVANAGSCPWTATSNAAWIQITSGSSGTGSASVSYSAAANTSTSPRTGTLTIAGRTHTVQQDAAASTGGPQLSGATNAASGVPSSLAGGGLAQGSFFSLYGASMGPAQYVIADSFPLQTTLGGVTIVIRSGGSTYPTYLHFVSATQANGIIDSRTPVGAATMELTYMGRTSSMPVTIVAHSFGSFSLAGGRGPGIIQIWRSPTDQPLNTNTVTAKPGDLIIIWGTGLGAISAPDNQPPPVGDLPYNVVLTIGGKVATRTYTGRVSCCAGIDVIYAIVPPDAPVGCNVPVQLDVEGTYSNVVTLAIDPNGQPCSSPLDKVDDILGSASTFGAIALIRAGIYLETGGGDPPTDVTLDLGAAGFGELSVPGGLQTVLQGLPMLQGLSVPPSGTCQAYTGNLDLSNLLGGVDISDPTGTAGGYGVETRGLNVGPTLTLSGPGGQRELALADSENPGLYVALLGGTLPLGDAPSMPLFMTQGTHTLSVPGGPDSGPFQTTFQVNEPINWTNRNQITTIRRDSPLTLNWTGGGAGQQVLVGAAATNQNTQATGGFLCVVPATAHTVTIQPKDMANMPSVPSGADLSDTGAVLGIVAAPSEIPASFKPGNLDAGVAIDATVSVRTVAVE